MVNKALTVGPLGSLNRYAVQNSNELVEWGAPVDTNFLKSHAERCRSLAENADEFTKRRLLDLAAHYDKRVRAAEPSVATRFLKTPLTTKDAPSPI
jgi:hypothetical protein